MDNEEQKIENALNLSLQATKEERDRSMNLDVGYDSERKTWEVIVKFSGDVLSLSGTEYEITYLLNNYAIVRASENKIKELAKYVQVEYIEKPKRLYFQRDNGILISCIEPVRDNPRKLSGQGVIVGILDSGIDYGNQEFRKQDGTTRIINLWDQTIEGTPPEGYFRGREYTQDELNTGIVGSKDTSGHGTEVAAVAAGANGVAFEADIIAVKLGNFSIEGFPKTTELMEGLDYMVKKSLEYKKPIAINISFGNTYGSHEGSSLLERFIDDVSHYGKSCICVGMGNEGNVSGHANGRLMKGENRFIELAVEQRQLSFDLQLWKRYEDDIEIYLITPSNVRFGPINSTLGIHRMILGETEILLYYGEPSPYSVLQEIYFEFIPRNSYVDSGLWKIELSAQRIVTGEYSLWLPSGIVLNKGTQFNNANVSNTLTIPSTAARVISVGAYNGRTLTYADFSGRGKSVDIQLLKPDVVAPGVDVMTVTSGGLSRSVSGTSYATPFVTGSAALLMEWGIVQGNDPYLYGEKMKSYLRKGAKGILGYENYPNNAVGYGRLCVRDSFPN